MKTLTLAATFIILVVATLNLSLAGASSYNPDSAASTVHDVHERRQLSRSRLQQRVWIPLTIDGSEADLATPEEVAENPSNLRYESAILRIVSGAPDVFFTTESAVRGNDTVPSFFTRRTRLAPREFRPIYLSIAYVRSGPVENPTIEVASLARVNQDPSTIIFQSYFTAFVSQTNRIYLILAAGPLKPPDVDPIVRLSLVPSNATSSSNSTRITRPSISTAIRISNATSVTAASSPSSTLITKISSTSTTVASPSI